MDARIPTLKGIHPGAVLERELRDRKLSKGQFALSINEYPQTLGAVTKGKRNMNTLLAMKIEEALGIEEGFFMTLQVFYDIREEKRRIDRLTIPDLSKIRKGLFWDTDIDKIFWHEQKRAVIERVFERGEDDEKRELIRFYGKEVVEEVVRNYVSTDPRFKGLELKMPPEL
jgi:plasmid maintenance system antidote protein VapI